MSISSVHFGVVAPEELNKFFLSLFKDGFDVKIFDKDRDRDVYNYFYHDVRNEFLWTYNIKNVEEFINLSNDLKASICGNYYTNIFEMDNSLVICFETGVVFVLSDNDDIINRYIRKIPDVKLVEMDIKQDYIVHKYTDAMIDGNYSCVHIYAFVWELYKKVYVKLIKEELLISKKYEYCNYKFLDFKKDIYDLPVTNKDGYVVQADEVLNLYNDSLDLENEFYRIYTTNKNFIKKKVWKYVGIGVVFVYLILFIVLKIGRK